MMVHKMIQINQNQHVNLKRLKNSKWNDYNYNIKLKKCVNENGKKHTQKFERIPNVNFLG